jgi:hypothetical protein
VDQAYSAVTYDEFMARVRDVNSAEIEQSAGVATMVAGSALILAGVARYVFFRGERPGRATLSAGVTRGGAVIAATGQF